MSSLTAKTLSHFEQSRSLERLVHELLDGGLRRLAIGDHEDAIADLLLSLDRNLFQDIQHLDTQLRTHVAAKEYDKALENALKIQKHMPGSYYGYHRAAQVYLIRREYNKALRAYHQGYKRISSRHGFRLLHKSVEATQHIFDHAAAEFANADQFEEANKIASWIILLLPTSLTGYLRAGELYEMYGLIKAAMQMYEQGMLCTSSDNQELFTDRMTGLKRTTHYDFIVQMPLEITSKIAQYLSVRDLIECLKVTKSWKRRIEQCPEAWRVLNVEYDGGNINVDVIQHVKRFVRHVTMKSASANTSLVIDLLASIGNGEFDGLRHLSLDRGTMDARYKPYLTNIFDRVNLTHLDLRFCSSKLDSYIPLHQILESCSHLKRLTYHTDSFATQVEHDLLPKEPTKITHLSIGGYHYYEGKVETPHFFIPLIPVFPHLVDLCITDSSPGDLQAISERCPNLRRLVVMQRPRKAFLDFPGLEHIPKGLQYLEINGYVDPKDVAGVIAQNSKTLLSINVALGYNTVWDGELVDPNWDWKHIPKLDCPVLTKLHFYMDYYWPFEQWIGDCPALADVRLRGVSELTDSIFDTFKRLPKLRSLDLEDCPKLTDAGLSRFFNDIQKQNSQLQTITVRFCSLLSTRTLLSLAALPSLRSLSIHACQGITEGDFQDFAAKTNKNNSITSVSFRSLNGLTDQALLQLLQALPRLRSLNLSHLNKITDSSVSTIADISSGISLSKLNIYCCKQITSETINKAKKLLDITQDYIHE